MPKSFISRLLANLNKADDVVDQIYRNDPANYLGEFLEDVIEGDPLVVKQKLAIETSNDTISLRLRALRISQTHLQSEIERLSHELYETNVSIEAFEAAEAVILPKLAPVAIPVDNVIQIANT